MAEHPILFKPEMVRAILEGRKTQTRRVLRHIVGIKGPVTEFGPSTTAGYDWHFRDRERRWHDLRHAECVQRLPARVGDRLWVRETWKPIPDAKPGGYFIPGSRFYGRSAYYRADQDCPIWANGPWKSPRHMPRAASRLTLLVTDVRVQRLQDISEDDAIAEGVEDVTREVAPRDLSSRFWKRYRDGGWNGYVDNPVGSYASLWTEINGPGAWDANPWVAAYTFTVEPRAADG